MPRVVHLDSALRILQAGTSLGDVGLLGRWLKIIKASGVRLHATQRQLDELSFYEEKYRRLLDFEAIHGAGSALNVKGREIDLMVSEGKYTHDAYKTADKATPFKEESLYSLPPRGFLQGQQ